MATDSYFHNNNKNSLYSIFCKKKEKEVPFYETIPERYKRKNYIIDKFNYRKKDVGE